jgi:hypothetical protein
MAPGTQRREREGAKAFLSASDGMIDSLASRFRFQLNRPNPRGLRTNLLPCEVNAEIGLL